MSVCIFAHSITLQVIAVLPIVMSKKMHRRSGSLGQTGWNAEIIAAQKFIDAFSGGGAQAEIAVVLYSGPRTWGGVYKCFSKSGAKVDMAAVCKISSVSHFTHDTQGVKQKVAGLMYWSHG
jgi:hypothetical protein